MPGARAVLASPARLPGSLRGDLDPVAAPGDERARELRARGADMDWDQAVAYTLAQATEALGELQPESQTWP
jgi:hypothetical protein